MASCSIRDSIKNGIVKAASGMLEDSGQFSKNYQLESEAELGPHIQALDDYLLEFMKPFGVQSEQIDNIKQRFGFDALGVTDTLNKLIWYSKNRNVETIPEEVGHMAVMLMGETHPYIKSLLTDIENWDEFENIKKEYSPVYKNEKQVKIEAVGKLLAKSLVKSYKANGLSKSLLEKALDFLNSLLENLLVKRGRYSLYLSDKIAINILMGNSNFIAKIKPSEPLNYDVAVDNNPLAKTIIKEFGTDMGNPLVGSLAIAGQNELIYRPSESPIHDLDFQADGSDLKKLGEIADKLESWNAIPVHGGWRKKTENYTTFTYLIPQKGFKIEPVNSGTKWVKEIKMFDESGKEVIPIPQNHMVVDFFLYDNGFEDLVIDNKFTSWANIYAGKMKLSSEGIKERLFQREKDQSDYVHLNPIKRNLVSNPAFIYYQSNTKDYTPITATAQEIVDDVNERFGEELVIKDEGNYKISPSQSLISTYEDSYRGPRKPLEPQINPDNSQILLEQLDVKTAEQFVNEQMKDKAEQIKRFRKANPDFRLEFGEEDSQYDPSSNTIFLNLPELFQLSKDSNIPFKQAVSILAMHEMGHAATTFALKIPENRKKLEALFQQALEYNKTSPFDDALRQGWKSKDGLAYSLTNIEEFAADSFSNPYFTQWLQTIPAERNFWEKLMDAVFSLFGIKKPDMYDVVIQTLNSSRIQKNNRESVDSYEDMAPQLTYRGQPRTHTQAAFDLYTSTAVEQEVRAIISKFPQAIIKIKQALSDTTNQAEKRKLQTLLTAMNTVREKEKSVTVMLSMIETVDGIARDIDSQIRETQNLPVEKQIISAYSLRKQAQAIEFILPLISDLESILKKEGNTKELAPFLYRLTRITSTISQSKRLFTSVTETGLPELLAEFVGESEAEKRIRKEIDTLTKELQSGIREFKDDKGKVLRTRKLDTIDIKMIQDQLKKYEAELKLVPNKANLKDVFKGLYEDASASQMYFEASIANGHPLVNTLVDMLQAKKRQVGRDILPTVNEYQRQLDSLTKALGKKGIWDTKKTYEPIEEIVERVDEITENPDGTIKYNYIKQRMLLSYYTPQYLKDSSEKTSLVSFYSKKLNEARGSGNDQTIEKYSRLYEEAVKNEDAFFEEFAESKYQQPVVDMYALLDKPLVSNPDTTFRKERGELFEKIDAAETNRNSTYIPEEQEKHQDEIKALYIELGQLKSLWDEHGNRKTGEALELAQIAQEFSEKRAENGKYVLTPEGKASFDKAIANLDAQLQGAFINQKQYDTAIAELSVIEFSEQYFEARKHYTKKIDEKLAQILQIPEFKSVTKDIDAEKIKDGYTEIANLVKGFRDNDGIIDGELFSKIRPQVVRQIRDIQNGIEQLKRLSEKMGGLPILERLEVSRLTKLKRAGTISAEEKAALEDLENRAAKGIELYKKHKALIDEYTDAVKQLVALTEGGVSSYYIEEVGRQMDIYVQQTVPALIQEAANFNSLSDGKYKKVDGRWRKLIIGGPSPVYEFVDQKKFSSEDEAVAYEIARQRAEEGIKQTQWWEDNHYEKAVVIRGEYVTVQEPIYIWKRSEPKNPAWILSKQPSIKFKTYKIYDGTIEKEPGIKPNLLNPNYDVLNEGLPTPKKGTKYDSEKYKKLTSGTDDVSKAYVKFLEFSRKQYREAQTYYDWHKKMGDILPSVSRTNDETNVELAQSVKHRSAKLLKGNISLGVGSTDSLDEQVLTGGGTSAANARNREIPTRFAGKMSIEKQSADIPAMLLAFHTAAHEYNQLSEIQPVMEAIREHASTLKVQEKRIAGGFKWANLISSKKAAEQNVEKKTDESTLSKTIDYVLDTQLYGETKIESKLNTPFGEIDLHKTSAALKSFSSRALFALNFFGAVKNSISAYIQGNINSHITEGYFTAAQYNKGHGKAFGFTKDFAKDFNKFGNKTKIGQELDFFQVFQGITYNEYGQKTAFNPLKEAPVFLTAPKAYSEFELQVAQYLAMSLANPVKVDGKWVEFREAFMLDANNNLVKKPGAELTDQQIDTFMKRIGYINRNLNGAYRQEERNALQRNVLGDLAFYLNGYMVPGITNRYSKYRYNKQADMITKGYHAQMGEFIKDLLTYRTNISKKWEIMTSEEKARVMRSLSEIMVVLGLLMLAVVLGSGDDGEELKEKSTGALLALSLAMAVKAETETFIPGPGFNEIARKMNSPFAALRQVTNIIKLMNNTALLTVGSDDAFYQTNTRFHDEGDIKAVADLKRLVGVTGGSFDPLARVMQIKNAQILR